MSIALPWVLKRATSPKSPCPLRVAIQVAALEEMLTTEHEEAAALRQLLGLRGQLKGARASRREAGGRLLAVSTAKDLEARAACCMKAPSWRRHSPAPGFTSRSAGCWVALRAREECPMAAQVASHGGRWCHSRRANDARLCVLHPRRSVPSVSGWTQHVSRPPPCERCCGRNATSWVRTADRKYYGR